MYSEKEQLLDELEAAFTIGQSPQRSKRIVGIDPFLDLVEFSTSGYKGCDFCEYFVLMLPA